MSVFTGTLTKTAEAGLLPDALLRIGIRNLLTSRLDSLPECGTSQHKTYVDELIRDMSNSELAICTTEANEQHYELPAEYFNLVLGPNKKYSSCYWDAATTRLDQAEANALTITCEHAELRDGQQILELGCGWGSLTLWMARLFPNASITAVSNSSSQKAWIDEQARQRGLNNVHVVTADMNYFEPEGRFDRVVSVEMFEHMRNWGRLYEKIALWLKPEGKFFQHVFCHQTTPYYFDDGSSQKDEDWMSRYFFSGGLMPAFDTPYRFNDHLEVQQRWAWEGQHYAKTLRTWLEKHDAQRSEILAIFRDVYGKDAKVWFERWRLFYLACEELFLYNQGDEWFVGHFLLTRKGLNG